LREILQFCWQFISTYTCRFLYIYLNISSNGINLSTSTHHFHPASFEYSPYKCAKRSRDASCLSVVSFNRTKRRIESFIVSYCRLQIYYCVQLNALFCCLWRNVEASCHKHFVVVSRYKHRRFLLAISVTTCGTVVRRRHIDNTRPVLALTAGSEARHRLRIAICAYPTCIRRPC